MAAVRRLLEIIGLLCKRTLEKRLYSAKETYNFEEPTNRSHPIGRWHRFGCRAGNSHIQGVATISRLLKIIGLFCII